MYTTHMKTSLTVDAESAGKRLDAWLAAQLPDQSRSRLQKHIKAGAITVNGKTVTPHLALSEGDVIAVDAPDAPPADAPLTPRPDIKLDILHEDADVVVVNKPSGLIVHPAVPGENGTLVNALLARYPEMATVGDDPNRAGIVHRLDREASGLLAVARTQRAFDALKAQFQNHTVHKEYAVLVDGTVAQDADTIRMAIGRSSTGKRMAARPGNRKSPELSGDDRPAVTHYHVEERFPRNTFLTVRTETGRTHQIRAHFHALGWPVVGDDLYGDKAALRLRASRLFLHCKALSFTHPVTGETMAFQAPLPPELETMLAQLRGAR